MKKLNLLSLIALTLILISTSCSTEKFSLSSNHQNRWKHGSKKVELVKYENLRSEKNVFTQTDDTIEFAAVENEVSKPTISENIDNLLVDEITSSIKEFSNEEKENTPLDIFTLSDETKDTIPNKKIECDLIILQNGDEINGKVTEVGIDEIRYLKCDNLSGPTYILKKSDVFIIKYSNGNKDVFKVEENTTKNKAKTDNRKPHALAIISFISSLLAFVAFGLPFGIIASITGIIGIAIIGSKPEKYKALTFAILGLIIGIVDIILMIAYFSK